MRRILFLLSLVLPTLALAQSQDENYIQSHTYTEPSTEVNDPETISTLTYYDGIGRPKQTIAVRAGSYFQNQFIPIIYDEYGRQTKQYLPYAHSGQLYIPLDCKDTDQLINLVNNKYMGNGVSTTNPNPYSETVLENSPLNRALEQGAPGTSWQVDRASDMDHTIKYEYGTNDQNEVRRFYVTFPTSANTEITGLGTTNYYGANTLIKKVIKDENWTPSDGKDKTTEEFTDKQGRTVLKRTYNDGVPHDTHYVYDKFSNLTYVIPPLAADNVYQRVFVNDFVNWNRPWTLLADVDARLADDYERRLADYDNSEILNLDLLNEYGGQGGFAITPNENGGVILDINITTATPMPYRRGQLVRLDDLGTFQDKELGRIAGPGYEYYFVIRGNAIEVDGYGNVPSLTTSLTGNIPLDYQRNYPWTKLYKADPRIAEDYEKDISGLDNSEILTTITPNPYNATGGVSVSLDGDDTINLSININSDQPMELNNGAILPLDFSRAVADRPLGTVSGPGYSYTFSIKSNTLNVIGSGTIGHLTFTGSFGYIKTVIQQPVIDGLCYIYHYDKRNRMIEKHVPGKGWEHIVYDKMNRPVFTQDEMLRTRSTGEPNWLFTKYDAFGRVIYTGEFYDARNRKDLQDFINAQTGAVAHEQRILPGTPMQGMTLDYSNDVFPTTGNILTVNYYDSYKFTTEGIGLNPAANYYGKALINNPVGLVTGTKVRVLDTNNWTTTVIAYDQKGRQIYSCSRNAQLNSQTKLHQLLSFSGLTEATRTEHQKLGTGFTVNTEDKFTYDHMGRLKEHSQKVNNNPEELIASNFYDELGRLVSKRVGGLYDPEENYEILGGMQEVNFMYNIRGWLTGINDVEDNLLSSTQPDLFAFRINYDTKVYSTSTALYNGNIAETSWKTKNDGRLRTYGYQYDDLNRLVSANVLSSFTYTLPPYTGQPENYKEGPITYDKNGNIKSLERWGLKSNNVTDKIDVLTYTYQPTSNKLLKVTDAAQEVNGFNNGDSGAANDYEYDINGNMTTDRNKGIGTVAAEKITYNHLNLPEKITFNSTKFIEYTYDAVGIKLQKTVTDGSTVTTTQYDNGFVYKNNVLQYFPHSEGYVEHVSSGNYSYIYQYKDHLGNIRLSYRKNTAGGIEIVEEANYYPFGLKHTGYNNAVVSSNIGQNIKYSGKELQDELDLNFYDFGARNYDPALGKWMNIDPMAEKYYPLSPYVYAINNPLFFVDPDGREIIIYYGKDNKQTQTYTYVKDRDYSNMDPFLADSYRALDALYTASNVTIDGKDVNLMDDLINHEKELSVVKEEKGYTGSYFKYGRNYEKQKDPRNPGNTAIGTLFFDNERGVMFDDVSNITDKQYFYDQLEEGKLKKNTKINSPTSVLGHEIGHAWNYITNPTAFYARKDGGAVEFGPVKYPNAEEAKATTLSTQININLGENPRTNYGGIPVLTQGVMSNKLKK